jgi:LacI family transcriptional regulator
MAGAASRKVTMSQIAEAAGVSVPTVSKVIHQRSDVAPETRQRVERLLIEHGYLAAQTAYTLRRGHSGFISLVVPYFTSAYEFEIIRGTQQALAEANCQLVLTTTHERPGEEDGWLSAVINSNIDGIILLLADEHSSYLSELQQRHIPFVVVDRLGELGPDIASVGATNWAGGRAATQYLLSLGHRRIGAIPGPQYFACTQDRFAGYRTALEGAGVAFDPCLIGYGDFTLTTGYEQTKMLLAQPEPPTAIFAFNDEQAAGVYRALHECGLAVPEQMSVIGFDDTLLASRLTPPLTTIRQPFFAMAKMATRMLLRLLAGETLESMRVELPTELIERSSCAVPFQYPQADR